MDDKIQEYWKNRMTLIHMGPLWIRNIFRNLYKFHTNKNILISGHFPHLNCPILVTGAGESLEYSIDFIKEKRNFFKILTVDTALSVLLENEIDPDYVIAMDAQIYNFYDFVKAKDRNFPLFFDITGYSGIPEILNGNIYPFISNFANTKILDRLNYYALLPAQMPALGSVGISAINLALKITSGEVFYTGLDFSYKIGKSHANGSPRNLSELERSNRIEPLEQPGIYYERPLMHNKDKSDKNCITDLILNSYADLMCNNFKQNERLLDIGETGLFSGGILTNASDLILKDECAETVYIKPDKNLTSINSFKEFCKNEIKLLNKLYDTTFLHLSGKSSKSKLILELLKEADYIYLHFPDKSPEPSIESGYLKRILISCGYYINILEKYL